jgi:2-polyprenyl-3-methyl-5-hydroxy-6-metoxy-1,4-benzoquinol methylase
MSTDKDWEQWGSADPYFGVVSRDKFRRARLDRSAIDEFFASGEQHVNRVFQLIGDNLGSEFTATTALDFGCGVGRLLLPIAKRTEHSTGVDISPSMIAEAAHNAESAGITNVSFALSDDRLSRVTSTFSLVHSYIVLQHIPWRRGRLILQNLSERVAPGGVLAVHMFVSTTAPRIVRAAVRLRYAIAPLHWLRNVIKGRPLFEPAMQLHIYDMPAVLLDLGARGFESPSIFDEPDMDGFRNVYLVARRAREAA